MILEVPFRKVHGSRNDFLLIDEEHLPAPPDRETKKRWAITLCDRKKGIGADGILFLSPSGQADGAMRIYNADGTEASMCGNGLRCAGRYFIEKTGKDTIFVETKKAVLEVKRREDGPDVPLFQVEISPVRFDPESLPMNTDKREIINEKLEGLSRELLFTALSVPNPHLIAIVSKEMMLSGEQERISAFVNGENPYFPDGVNVSFVYPIREGEIFVKTYERGVGFTNACGTAMSAASLVAATNGYAKRNSPVTVYNNGGFVRTVISENGDKIFLIGNGTYEYDGVFRWQEDAGLAGWAITRRYPEEEAAYARIERKAREKIREIFGVDKV